MDLLAENEGNPTPDKFPMKNKSCAMPPLSLFPMVQVFFNTVAKEICTLRTNSISGCNFIGAESKAITSLSLRKRIRGAMLYYGQLICT